MAGPACAGPLGQIEPTIATVDDTAVPDRLSISCHLLAVQIGCSLSAQQVPLCLTLQRVSRPFLRVTFFKASWAGTADSRRRRRQYLFSGSYIAPHRRSLVPNCRICKMQKAFGFQAPDRARTCPMSTPSIIGRSRRAKTESLSSVDERKSRQ